MMEEKNKNIITIKNFLNPNINYKIHYDSIKGQSKKITDDDFERILKVFKNSDHFSNEKLKNLEKILQEPISVQEKELLLYIHMLQYSDSDDIKEFLKDEPLLLSTLRKQIFITYDINIKPHEHYDLMAKYFIIENFLHRSLAPLYDFIGMIIIERGDTRTLNYYSSKRNDEVDDVRSRQSPLYHATEKQKENPELFFILNYWLDKSFFHGTLFDSKENYKQFWNNFDEEIFRYILDNKIFSVILRCQKEINVNLNLKDLIKDNRLQRDFSIYVALTLDFTEGSIKPHGIYNGKVNYRIVKNDYDKIDFYRRITDLRNKIKTQASFIKKEKKK